MSLHEGVMGGHLGVEKTLDRLKERFYWPGHYMDVSNWCRNCPICCSRKNPPKKARAPLKTIKAGYPLRMVAIDIMGPFPLSSKGNDHILVICDYFTRWVEAFGIPNQAATTVADKLMEFILRFGVPEQLHSDQGRSFESDVIALTRCIQFFHLSFGWFDCTEPSLPTALQGKQGVQGGQQV